VPAPAGAQAARTGPPITTSSAGSTRGPIGPAPASANTGRTSSTASAGRHQAAPPGSTTSGDELARIRRIIAALLRKAAATTYPHEAAACREKAEALRAKYGL
jgi:hypothetical protein